MPRNSIIGYRISDRSGNLQQAEIFYPFFSPHLSLPIKPGEQVWVIYETVGGSSSRAQGSLGYWVSRKHVDDQVDDINYTHASRMDFHRSRAQQGRGSRERTSSSAQEDGSHILQNHIPGFPNGDGSGNLILPGPNAFEKIIKRSRAMGRRGHANQFIGEPVPRITKTVGDLVLQGSNNASIVLGTEHTRDSSPYLSSFPSRMAATGQGAIDICAGRAQTDSTAAAHVAHGIINERGYRESSKYPTKELRAFKSKANAAEGSMDPENDLSRIYVSMATDPDNMFSIDTSGMSRTEVSAPGEPSIVLKTDHMRLVARQDLKIVIGDSGTGSAVVLKADGNIVFIPGPEGVIKLGGDDADKALIVAPPTKTLTVDGSVSLPLPLVTIAGGTIGEAEEVADTFNFTTFATKVLVK
tara:strand:- start:411 stop:1646 length:1236 start_codon:yes stop_codon:yes gene_type:complete